MKPGHCMMVKKSLRECWKQETCGAYRVLLCFYETISVLWETLGAFEWYSWIEMGFWLFLNRDWNGGSHTNTGRRWCKHFSTRLSQQSRGCDLPSGPSDVHLLQKVSLLKFIGQLFNGCEPGDWTSRNRKKIKLPKLVRSLKRNTYFCLIEGILVTFPQKM